MQGHLAAHHRQQTTAVGRHIRSTIRRVVQVLPGSGAGIFWSLANICSTFAVLRGGNAVTSAQINAAGLITSGGWGLLYYREIRGWPAVAWIASASFSAAMAVLLGFEKAK